MDPSGTDLEYTRIDLTVSCVVNPAYGSIIGVATNAQGVPYNSSAAGIMEEIRAKLMKPKQAFLASFAGINLLPGNVNANGNVDARNGPIPQFCQIYTLTNSTFLVIWRVVAHYWENTTTGIGGTKNNQGNSTISNRWEESVQLDARGYTTRTRRGRVVIRSDNATGAQADDTIIRQNMAAVAVPTGFLRESSEWTIDPTGLGVAYTVKDVEQYLMPPAPAYKADGSYSESVSLQGYASMAECRVNLIGNNTPATAKNKLLTTALDVAFTQCGLNIVGVGKPIIQNLVCRTPLYDNGVDVVVRVLKFPGTKDSDALARFKAAVGPNQSRFVQPPLGSNPGPQPPYTLRGTANAFARAAAYFDPSLVNTIVDATGQFTNGSPVGTAGINGG